MRENILQTSFTQRDQQTYEICRFKLILFSSHFHYLFQFYSVQKKFFYRIIFISLFVLYQASFRYMDQDVCTDSQSIDNTSLHDHSFKMLAFSQSSEAFLQQIPFYSALTFVSIF